MIAVSSMRVRTAHGNSFDHLAGAGEHGWRQRQTERLGGRELMTNSYLVGFCTGSSLAFRSFTILHRDGSGLDTYVLKRTISRLDPPQIDDNNLNDEQPDQLAALRRYGRVTP